MSLTNNELKLNAKYDFLRRSVISYYSRCMNVPEDQQKQFQVPCGFDEIMKFTKDLFYNYIREDYKQ